MMYLFFDYLEVLLGAIFIGVFCDVEQKKQILFDFIDN